MSIGVGAHEIVVDSAYHHKDFSDLPDSEVTDILNIYAQRTLDLEKDKRFKYILIFKNHGSSAGASMEHPHSQIIALPMVPKNVKEELYGAQRYFDYRERCVFCDMIQQEIEDKQRIIAENKNFIMFCPFVSRFPFEVWIIPRKHTSFFCQTPYELMPDLAVLLRSLIGKVKKVFGNPAYNFIVHSAPINSDANSTDSYHWHLEFIPQLTRVAGFEWGTGFYLVPTPPEVAAKLLREA
jgi:UDPglucose--hexose-1-phosphate uridylyltransferase